MPSREQILASARNAKPEPFDVPEWGGEIYLRVLSAKDQLALTEDVAPNDIPFRVLVGCVCDENGTLIFQDGDEEALKEQPFPTLMHVFAEAARLNGLSSPELDEAMSRFERTQGDATSSG